MTEELKGLAIIDGHAHIASIDFIPLSFAEGVVDNILVSLQAQGMRVTRDRVRQMYLDTMQDGNCTQLLDNMKRAGIARTVLLLPDFTFKLRDATLTIAEMIERHRKILERHPDRFYVMAGVDPRWGKDGVDLFEKAVADYGFHGLKLYPPCGYSPSDPALFPYYEICRARSLPVLLHTGGTSPALDLSMARPILVDHAASKFPDVRFILAHASTTYMDECIMLCASRPNVYADISGFQSQPLSRLQHMFSYGINSKLIFGTDWPVFRMQGPPRDVLKRLCADDGPIEDLSPHEVRRFFNGTIRSLLPPHAQVPIEVEDSGTLP